METAILLLGWGGIQYVMSRPLSRRQRKTTLVVSIVLVSLLSVLVLVAGSEKSEGTDGGVVAVLCLYGLPLTLSLLTVLALGWTFVVAPVWRIMGPGSLPPPEPAVTQAECDQRERAELERYAEDEAECAELRLACELLYRRHAGQLQNSLPPEKFQSLLDTYLGGDVSPRNVRERADMVKQLITDQANSAAKSKGATYESLQELAEHFAAARREVEALPYGEDVRETFITALNEQETNAIESFFRRDQP